MRSSILAIFLIFKSNLVFANYAGELVLDSAKSYGITDERLLLMIHNSKADLSVKDKKGMTALHWSARKGRASTARVLCENGADPNARDNEGNTPLMYAVEDLYIQISQTLMDCGADPGVKNNRGISPLDMGRRYKHKELTTMMVKEVDYRKAERAKDKFLGLRKKKKAKSRWKKMSTGISAASGFNQALLSSIEKRNERAAMEAIKKGANPNYTLKGMSVLMMAINKKMDNVAVELIDKGANPKYTFKGMSTLMMAINKKSDKVAVELIEKGADPKYTFKGMTALVMAIRRKREKVAEVLAQKSDPRYTFKGMSTLMMAINNNMDSVAKSLVKKGADPKLTFKGTGVLLMALKSNMNDVARDLIKKGADVKQIDLKGITTLELAVKNNDADITDYLIRHGADAQGYASNREPHLVNATINKDLPVIKVLLKGGASIVETGKLQKSPLDLAMENKLDDIFAAFLEKINLKGDYCDLQYKELLNINFKKYKKVTNFTSAGVVAADMEMDELSADMGMDWDKTLEANAQRGLKYKIGQYALSIFTGPVTGPMALVYSRKSKKYKKVHKLLRSALEDTYNRDIILLGREAKVSVPRTRQWLVVGNVTKAFCAGKRLNVLSEKGIMKWVRSRK